jgi:hypothetical protein
MSAKHSKKGAAKSGGVTPAAAPTPVIANAGNASAATAAPAATEPSWLDSADPKKRLWGKIIFIGVWVYVAALWLLALDQTFNWGIFGPKVPPVP